MGTETVPVRTVNRQCSSGLQAVADVAAAIKAGFYDVGMLNMIYEKLVFFCGCCDPDLSYTLVCRHWGRD